MNNDDTKSNRLRSTVADELNALEQLMKTTASDSQPVELDQQSVGRVARVDAMQRQAMAAETLRRRRRRRLQLMRTLQRMDEGEYGYCTSCGNEIPDGRLAVDPTFHLCVKCAE